MELTCATMRRSTPRTPPADIAATTSVASEHRRGSSVRRTAPGLASAGRVSQSDWQTNVRCRLSRAGRAMRGRGRDAATQSVIREVTPRQHGGVNQEWRREEFPRDAAAASTSSMRSRARRNRPRPRQPGDSAPTPARCLLHARVLRSPRHRARSCEAHSQEGIGSRVRRARSPVGTATDG